MEMFPRDELIDLLCNLLIAQSVLLVLAFITAVILIAEFSNFIYKKIDGKVKEPVIVVILSLLVSFGFLKWVASIIHQCLELMKYTS